ncbi:MAG: glycerol-3-phosphate dehydrogenase, partial [Kiritimatiellae bacterium]|nr:glycerol-3-phosphate dehydrogenase [Kiritimatiellia bacterium]
MTQSITVLGDGGWGTALALKLLLNGHHVTLWGPFAAYLNEVRSSRENRKFLAGVSLPGELVLEADSAKALAGADGVVL